MRTGAVVSPLKGRKQSAEHVQRRVAAVTKARAAWSDERRAAYAALVSASGNSRTPEARAKNAAAHRGVSNHPNKGSNWKTEVTAAELREIRARWSRRRRSTVKGRLHSRVSCQIRIALKGRKAGWGWERLVGYTVADLEAHLATTMPAGYSWDDFRAGRLHIDHIIPVRKHNFSAPEHIDFLRCWALTNLQLLPAAENYSKHDRINGSFQPALQLGVATA